jgi:hypothetical protein
MAMIDRNFTFATNGTVSAADLHNLIDSATIYQDLITGQLPITSVGTNYELLIADATNPNAAPNAVTVYDLFDDALSVGTYTGLNLTGALTYGTATGTRLVSANATITTGTITTGVIPSLTAGTTTSTAATITSGTITNLASTTGTIATLNSTTGTIATLNSTTGTITNLSTTLAGDFTISNGTGTLGTSGATAGTYGSVTAIPFLTVNAKGIITSATTGTFSSTPADGSITPAKLSQPFTSATAVASTSGTAINFTGIPSWVKRVTVILNEVGTADINGILIQIGDSGGIGNTGYISTSVNTDGAGGSAAISRTDGYVIKSISSIACSGLIQIANISGNTWIESHSCKVSTTTILGGGGSKTLSGTLDRIRVTTVGATDTFDAGSVNIMYEG